MTTRHLLTASIALSLMCAPALAQGMQPAQSGKQTPTVNAPATTPRSTTGAATAPAASKVNLNTATEAELGKLPKIGPAQAKAIVEARTNAKFKDWKDFAARKVIPADAAAGIKRSVAF